MIYPYKCDKCGEIDREFATGKAPNKIKCACGTMAHRIYMISVSVPNPTSEARAGRGKGR